MQLDRKHLRANLLLLATAIIWGLAFTAQRVGAQHVGPFTFNAVRFALGAALITAVIKLLDLRRKLDLATRRRLTRATYLPGLWCGTLLTAATGLQQAAMIDTTAGNAAFVTGLYLPLVPLLGLFVGKKVSWLTWFGILLALIGLYFVAIKETFSFARGDGLVILAAVCFAFQIVAVDAYTARLAALRFAASQFWFCALTSAICAPIFDSQPFAGLSLALVPLLYGGLISVGLAYTFQILAQRDSEPTQASLIMALEAVFGALGGALLLHENMGGRGYLGAALMAAGILLSQVRPTGGHPHHAATPTVRQPSG
jgi:drug/metabolite transporter (DMT)-like permease